jgi:photosystem II stability/assembly factor-like uncharacterized protein
MEEVLILATNQGAAIFKREEYGWQEVRRGLNGSQATSVIAREGVILTGTRRGVFRSDDLGISWSEASSGLATPHIRWLAYHPARSDFEIAGTEPAAIYISKDGAKTWEACPEVEEMRKKFGWSLPYSPEAGCVRGFAIQNQRAYAAVEDGCVLVSDNAAESWRLAQGSYGYPDHRPKPGFIHSDVHSIEMHPSSPDLVYAPTGGGFYHSKDGGRTWSCLYPGIYCRAAWVDPLDPNHIILGPADGVDYLGRIEATRDLGRTWEPASAGLVVPWQRYMVERFIQVGDELLAVLSNGTLLSARLDTLVWKRIAPEIDGVNAATVLEM